MRKRNYPDKNEAGTGCVIETPPIKGGGGGEEKKSMQARDM